MSTAFRAQLNLKIRRHSFKGAMETLTESKTSKNRKGKHTSPAEKGQEEAAAIFRSGERSFHVQLRLTAETHVNASFDRLVRRYARNVTF